MTDGLAERAALERDAACWRALVASPHCAEIIAEWVEWSHRRDGRLSAHDISNSRGTWVHLTYAELHLRRYPPHGSVPCWVGGGCSTCT